MSTARPLTVILGHKSAVGARLRRELEESGLTDTVAIVISTYRPDSVDTVLDHALWVAAARAISNYLHADASEVEVDAEPRILDRLLHRIPALSFGSFESYAELLAQDSDPVLWQLVRWRRQDRLVAVALHEAWWRVGGPELFHDSYTACFFVSPCSASELVEPITARVKEEGGVVEQVLDHRATDTA